MALNNTELTEFARVHNAAIARHEQWLTEHEAAMQRIDNTLASTTAQQEINAQQLTTLTAGLLELRNLVADSLQGRSQ